jgi:PAS domain S-box-containing protein
MSTLPAEESMLSEILDTARDAIVRDVEPRAAATEHFGIPSSEQRARLNALIDELREALQRGSVDEHLRAPSIADEPDFESNQRQLLQRYITEQIESRHFDASVAERTIVSKWVLAAERDRLREQAHRLAALLDRLDESAVILSPDGRIRYINRRAAKIVHDLIGLSMHEIMGKTFRELGVPAELQIGSSSRELVALAREETAYEVDLLGRAKEGRFSAVYGPDGTVTAVEWTGRDIHDRKLEGARLDILSKLSVLVGSLDYDEVPEALARVPIPELADWCAVTIIQDGAIGRTFVAQRDPAKEALRKRVMRVAATWRNHPLWQEMLTGGFQLLAEVSKDLLRRITVDEEQYRIVSQVGLRSLMVVPLVSRLRLAGIITFAFTDESGRRYGRDHPTIAGELALHAAHIIENARLMKDLKATETRFRVALARAGTVVFEQDRHERYSWYYNPISPMDVIGKTSDEVFPRDEAALLRNIKQRVLERGESASEQVDLTVFGDRRHYRETIEPLRDRTGKIVGLIGAATDITDEHRAQKALQEAIGFRERLMGILGHDLRNPLMAVTMGAELLLSENLPGEARDHVLRIQRSARRMDEMIGTLLDFTRLRILGGLPLCRVSADLGSIVRDAIDELGATWPGRTIDLEVQGDTRGQWDPNRISQMTCNLVGNALAYGSNRGTVHVSVGADGADVSLIVRNSGPPIPADLLPILFEPFRRGVPDDHSPRGLGLGLYIVKQIALAHHGDVSVESTPEHGTAFTVRLPRNVAAPLHETAPAR